MSLRVSPTRFREEPNFYDALDDDDDDEDDGENEKEDDYAVVYFGGEP